MKTTNTLMVIAVMLLLAAWQPIRAQEVLASGSQNQNNQVQMADPDQKSIKDTYWIPSTLGKGIYYRGYVGINTTAPERELDVVGTVRVSALDINGQYSLPTTKGTAGQYLSGLGEWTTLPSSGSGGYWQSTFGTGGIYFSGGNVGIGTTGSNANAKLQVIGNMNIGNNPHTGSQLGEYAFVGGLNSIASGNYSFSFGREAKATHMNSVAIGFKAEAKSEMTVGIGYRVYANAECISGSCIVRILQELS